MDTTSKNKDINSLKARIKDILTTENVLLDDECLNEVLDFIDDSEVMIDNTNVHFLTSDYKNFTTAFEVIFKKGKDSLGFSDKLQSELKKMFPKHFTQDVIYLYMIRRFCNFNWFRITRKTITFDALISHIDTYYKGVYDFIFECNSDDKMKHKSLFTPTAKYIYKIDFGEHGVYIGQTKNVKSRMSSHKRDAKNGNHCYAMNELYKNHPTLFENAIKNVTILDRPLFFDFSRVRNGITSLEYQYQVEALQNGERVLGRQCWDDDFRNYLAYNVDEFDYQKLLAWSYEINNDPNINKGYSLENPRLTKTYRHMNYEDVVKYFETLRKEKENT